MEQPNNNSPCAPLLSSIPMTFLVFHFDTISCSIEFHFQIHSSTFENSHSRLIDSIKVLFSFFYGFFKSESKHNETLSMLSERRAGELRTVNHFVYDFAEIYDPKHILIFDIIFDIQGLWGFIYEIFKNFCRF